MLKMKTNFLPIIISQVTFAIDFCILQVSLLMPEFSISQCQMPIIVITRVDSEYNCMSTGQLICSFDTNVSCHDKSLVIVTQLLCYSDSTVMVGKR